MCVGIHRPGVAPMETVFYLVSVGAIAAALLSALGFS
jgi:hypothetical protein